MRKKLYAEPADSANKHRVQMLAEVRALVRNEQAKSDRKRREFFRPDMSSVEAYAASIAAYRRQFREMLGWPLAGDAPSGRAKATVKPVAEDSLGRISRVWIDTLPGVRTYGLFFQPNRAGRAPLVIAQHGGAGTPELAAGFFGSANYNDMVRRVLRRGAAVFAPQLLLWDASRFGAPHGREAIDRRLKQLGGSLAALELFRIIRSIDYFAGREDIDAQRVGMLGLSYGGFYTLFAAALDERIKAAYSSCFFSNRKVYDWYDWVWFNSANRFLDAEAAMLVCPRALYLEAAKADEVFRVRYAGPEAAKVRAVYRKLRIPGRFRYAEHRGRHELDKSDDGISFMFRCLKAVKAQKPGMEKP